MFLLSGNSELENDAIEAAVRAGVGSVVKPSALAVGLDPPPFHRRIEEKLESSGLGFTHLRPTAFMQTLAGYLPALIDAEGVLRLPGETDVWLGWTPGTSPLWPSTPSPRAGTRARRTR
jgi:uncharacterized protein YbjT (DUF2867 family)